MADMSFAKIRQLAGQAGRGVLKSLETLFSGLVDGTVVVYPRVAVGSIAANATEMFIGLGWIPDYVRVVNITDGGPALEWCNNTNDTAIQYATTITQVTSGGITPLTTLSTTLGFKVGIKATISGTTLNGKALRYMAVKNRPSA